MNPGRDRSLSAERVRHWMRRANSTKVNASVGARLCCRTHSKQESFMNWSMKSWSELTTDELHELLALRAEVFVVGADLSLPGSGQAGSP